MLVQYGVTIYEFYVRRAVLAVLSDRILTHLVEGIVVTITAGDVNYASAEQRIKGIGCFLQTRAGQPTG